MDHINEFGDFPEEFGSYDDAGDDELVKAIMEMSDEEVANLPKPPDSVTEQVLRMIGAHDASEDNLCPYCGGTITIVDGKEVGHHPAC